MGKFGKRNVVSKSITDYNIAVLGLSGIGKTTLMVNVCEKLVGDEGYIIFNMGKEDGISCIDGAVYENIENWKKFEEVTKDIISNKKTDYPELKIVVLDTIDQLFDIAEKRVIDMYNQEKRGEKNFKQIASINAAYGGFGAGLDKTVEIVLNKIWELKKVGIAVWMCGHTKNKDIVDPLTDQTYTTISANLSQKYFNAIKTKMHIVGMAVIDRDIVTESTGRKDIYNKDIMKSKVVSEARKIIFRDDNYGVDSKSRFADIADEIPLDADAFIKAIQDAIFKAEKENKSSVKKTVTKKPEPEMEEEEFDSTPGEVTEELTADDELFNDVEVEEAEEEIPIEELQSQIQKLLKSADDNKKEEAKKIIRPYKKLTNVPRDGLMSILDVLA